MDRTDTDQLWTQVRALLRAPSPPDDPELRRAARLLASSRSDAVELLLARWLAEQQDQAAHGAEPQPQPDADPARSAAVAPARTGFGVREALLVTGGVAGGALVASLLGDEDGGGLL